MAADFPILLHLQMQAQKGPILLPDVCQKRRLKGLAQVLLQCRHGFPQWETAAWVVRYCLQ